MGRPASLGLVRILVLQKIYFIRLCSQFQNSSLQQVRSILIDCDHTGLGAQLQKFNRIAYQNRTLRLRTFDLLLASPQLTFGFI